MKGPRIQRTIIFWTLLSSFDFFGICSAVSLKMQTNTGRIPQAYSDECDGACFPRRFVALSYCQRSFRSCRSMNESRNKNAKRSISLPMKTNSSLNNTYFNRIHRQKIIKYHSFLRIYLYVKINRGKRSEVESRLTNYIEKRG